MSDPKDIQLRRAGEFFSQRRKKFGELDWIFR
jgi:hypothetical protein